MGNEDNVNRESDSSWRTIPTADVRKAWKVRSVPPVEYSKDKNFVNRELSWLEFNERVLHEARDRKNPLMERLTFLSITQSNLDEFFMVRVASLKDQLNANYLKKEISGLLPSDQLAAICERTHAMTARMYSTFNRSILPLMQNNGFMLYKPEDLNARQKAQVEKYFDSTIYPILTPMAVDSSRPFPLIYNKMINLAILLKKDVTHGLEERFCTIQIPNVVPRLYVLDAEPGGETTRVTQKNIVVTPKVEVVLLEDIIRMNIEKLFEGFEIKATAFYRIMRNADMEIDEEDAADLLVEIEKQLRLRDFGEVIKLEINDDIDDELLTRLMEAMRVDPHFVYSINGPLDLTLLNQYRGLDQCKAEHDLYYSNFTPQPVSIFESYLASLKEKGEDEPDVFSAIREGDILMYHPYETFDLVVDLVRRAARDPQVLAIKQTLYRVSGNSPIIKYLGEAAINGKQVLVLVELKARFDEENNIHWAKALEKAGCHVIYGLVGLKTHSKITLVVRREDDGIRRYVHLGTGNYNDQTAKLYTDMGLLTAKESFGVDATEFFNMISGYSEPDTWNKLIPAPYWLRPTFIELIEREINHAKAGLNAAIVAKMNSLVDQEIIEYLYAASQAGVTINLIVRGICCLRPGVPGLSENIHVRSLIGRYLEHARVYYFENDGHPEIFLSSADWMPRNLDRRIELMYPIEDRECFERVREVLSFQMRDNLRAHIGRPDGTYRKPDLRGHELYDSQIASSKVAVERHRNHFYVETNGRAFIPITTPPEEPAFMEDEALPEELRELEELESLNDFKSDAQEDDTSWPV
ncbi:MAG: RNA degradosome polyphosphate kinase [Fastidiosipilaceae bacterium]|jgi:polyphosphate kinase